MGEGCGFISISSAEDLVSPGGNVHCCKLCSAHITSDTVVVAVNVLCLGREEQVCLGVLRKELGDMVLFEENRPVGGQFVE